MARAEIDSFIVKFKTLLLSGKKSTLVIKSNNGKAEVSLDVELGEVIPPPHHRGHGSRDGPSRQRRRQRRAAAREVQKTENENYMAAEATIVDEVNQKEIEHNTLKDEFCSDEIFKEKDLSSLDNNVNGDLVDKIVVKYSDVHQKSDTEKVVKEKLLSVGIEANKIESVRVEQGTSNVVVKLKPVDKKRS